MSGNDNFLHTVNDFFNKMSKEFVTVDGNVKKVQKENLTPFKVATVILIREYCNENSKGRMFPLSCAIYFVLSINITHLLSLCTNF